MGSKPKSAKPDEFSEDQLNQVYNQFRGLTRAFTAQSNTQTMLLKQQGALQKRTAREQARGNRQQASLVSQFLRTQQRDAASTAREQVGNAAASTDLARRASIYETNQTNSARDAYRKSAVTTQLRLSKAFQSLTSR